MENNSDSVNRILEMRRERAERDREKREEEVYEKIPRIRDIDEISRKLTFDIIDEAISGGDYSSLVGDQEALKEEKDRLLKEEGYPDDYLKIKYYCNKCNDTGVYKNHICSCKRQLMISREYKMSSIEENLLDENFENFDLSLFRSNPNPDEDLSPRENMEEILDFLEDYIKGFSKGSENIVFYGPVGTGKTYLLNCIAREIINRGFSILYNSAPSLFEEMNRYQFSSAEDKKDMDQKMERIYQCDLLIIDDLGTEVTNSMTRKHLFEIINRRLINRKTMMISTNIAIKDFQDLYDDRIYSRILGNFLAFDIYGDDLRIKKLGI